MNMLQWLRNDTDYVTFSSLCSPGIIKGGSYETTYSRGSPGALPGGGPCTHRLRRYAHPREQRKYGSVGCPRHQPVQGPGGRRPLGQRHQHQHLCRYGHYGLDQFLCPAASEMVRHLLQGRRSGAVQILSGRGALQRSRQRPCGDPGRADAQVGLLGLPEIQQL